MVRFGLIKRYGGYWSFSDSFEGAWLHFIEKVKALRYPASSVSEEGMERIYIEAAKVENVMYQLRKVGEKNHEINGDEKH